MSVIVHINGWPGTGKLTIARILTEQLNGRLIDNHTLLNPAERLYVRGTPEWKQLRVEIRTLVFEHVARLPPDIPIVMTDALAEHPDDIKMFNEYRALSSRRGARLVPVVLQCTPEENRRRLRAAGRGELLKLVDAAVLDDLRAKYELLRPAGLPSVELGVDGLSAADAATALFRAIQAQTP